MKRLVFDLDGTLTHDDPDVGYPERAPNAAVVEKLRAYREQGFTIVICSARNMRTYAGDLGKINAHTLPVIVDEVGEPDEDGDVAATARSQADAPEIDGQVFLRNVPASLRPGDFASALIEDADAHDLFGVIA